jgi:nicotinate-nucleotide adenylyltransferase
VSLVEVPALSISSTDCRDRVARGMPVWYLVPDGVVQYMEKRGLYRQGHPARRAGSQGRPVGDRPTYDRPPPDPVEGTAVNGHPSSPPSAEPPSAEPPSPQAFEVPR